MRRALPVLVLLLTMSGTAHALTLDIFSGPVEYLTAPNGGTVSVTTTSDQILGGTRDAVFSFATVPWVPSYTLAVGRSINGEFFMMNATLLLTWDAGGAGLNLDATPYGGVFYSSWASDGNAGPLLRFYTTPTDYFVIQKGHFDLPIPGKYVAPSYASEGIWPYSYFTVVGNPDWAHIDMIQAEMVLRSSAIHHGNVRLTTLPAPVPDGSSTLLLGLVALSAGALVHLRRT